jgi:DnaJ-class molecular chaperone
MTPDIEKLTDEKPSKPVCPYCKGSGVEADYVGPEMRCVATTCSHCNGEGFDPDWSPRVLSSERREGP